MFDSLLKSKFYTKCKSAIKQTKTRIQIVKRKRNAMVKYLKNDVSDLLKNGLDSNAYGRVEGLWNELNLSSGYDFVEKFCVHISTHLQNMNKQSECPEEVREAVSSLIFAAARFADLPELRDLRAAFTEKYGHSTDLYANKEFVSKLKATPPTNDMKLQLMRDIAAEYGIHWDSKTLEQNMYNNNLPVPALHSHKNEEIEESFAETMVDDIAVADDALNKQHQHQRVTGSPQNEEPWEEKPKGLVASEREVVGVGTSDERKEQTENEISLPMRKESAIDEPKTEDERPWILKPFRPPYTKTSTSNVVSSLTTPPSPSPTGNGNKEAEHRKEPGLIDRENNLRQGEQNAGKGKPVPKSVRRRRFMKPQSGPVDEDEEEESKNPIKVAMDRDPTDEEEKELDNLLANYSKKKSSSGIGKLESAIYHHSPQPSAADNLTSRSLPMDNKGKDPPRRTSLPTNESSPSGTPRKQLSKAASFQAKNCQTHPKVPDYDEFVARLAAYRSKAG